MKILLLSPYDAMSHQYWREGLVRHLPDHVIEVVTLPARYFSWRVRGNSLTLSQDARLARRFDLIIATSMTDTSALYGMQPLLAGTPTILYFHENQFHYPADTKTEHLVERQVTSLYAAMVARCLVFNSEFNRRTFIEGVTALLKKLPDGVPAGIPELLLSRSRIMPVPLGDECFQVPQRDQTFSILWNHRWEYDKGLLMLHQILKGLLATGIDFRFHLIGQQFRQHPEVMDEIRGMLATAGKLGEWGFVADRNAYLRLLASSHCVLSTALHEFQGLAVQEAMASGCIPVVPDSLVYPEYVPAAWRYRDVDGAIVLLGKAAATRDFQKSNLPRWQNSAIDWQNLVREMWS